MPRLFCLVILVALCSPAVAKEYAVGDLVVAVTNSTLRVRRGNVIEETDTVFPGVTMRVGAVHGRWLWVSNGVPGWIKHTEVIPLDRAIDYFTAKIDSYPSEAQWRYARAVAWANKGELDIAIADYTELIKLKRTPAFYHVRGICYHAKGEYDRAIRDYNEAIRIDPRSARYYNSRSESWYEKGEYLKAISDSDDAIRMEPNLASAYTNRGRAYVQLGEPSLAIEDYKKSLQLDPNYDLAYTHYAWLMATSPDAQLRDGQKALRYAQRACQLTNWEDPHALGVFAAANAEAGQFEEAVKWEQEAQSLYTPETKVKWAFLLELYKEGKPYRQEMQDSAG